MSAWDIAGAVTFGLLAAAFFYMLAAWASDESKDPVRAEGAAIAALIAFSSLAVSVFCLARLCGAHA